MHIQYKFMKEIMKSIIITNLLNHEIFIYPFNIHLHLS